MRLAATTPHQYGADANAQDDTSSRDRPEGRLNDAQEAGSDAERHDSPFHWTEPAAPDVDLHLPLILALSGHLSYLRR